MHFQKKKLKIFFSSSKAKALVLYTRGLYNNEGDTPGGYTPIFAVNSLQFQNIVVGVDSK